MALPAAVQSAGAQGGGGANLGSTGSGGSVLGNDNFLGGFLSDVYGSKYGIPNPTGTAGSAIAGNEANLSGIYGLAMGADAISAAGAQSQYTANLPNYSGMLTQATGNVGSELQGQVPQDVINLLQQQGAERGVATGQGAGGPNTNASYLQALGLTSLGLENQGMQGFNQLYQDTPTGAQFNPSSMFVTPEQEQAAQLAANQEAAAPDPQMAGIMENLDF
jgi:hypothetical protein